MSELKAAPGPWLVDCRDDRSINVRAGKVPIAELWISPPTAKANAALIAAAPELYAALEALFACDMEHVLMFDGKEDQVAAIQLARAALKKARGEA